MTRRRALYFWRKYKLTSKSYNFMLRRQRNQCAICRTHRRKRRLYVDHDHKTGRVRGLLCFVCNKLLVGRSRNGVLHRRAADYLDSAFDARNFFDQRRTV